MKRKPTQFVVKETFRSADVQVRKSAVSRIVKRYLEIRLCP